MAILEKVFLVIGVPKLLALLHPISQDLAGVIGWKLESASYGLASSSSLSPKYETMFL